MSNGSLEGHLYPQHGVMGEPLDLVQMVSICSDVAEGVAYLHHHSPDRVVHCDLKPSNILLDDDMTAIVADFGIAQLVTTSGTEAAGERVSASFTSADRLLCGSVGYIAPEYGIGTQASTRGDVYSFGVLLLEIVSGLRPTDALFHQGSNLGSASPSCCKHVITELIELGLTCTQYSPSTRPNMMDVAHEMTRLKQYLLNPSSSLIEGTSLKLNII